MPSTLSIEVYFVGRKHCIHTAWVTSAKCVSMLINQILENNTRNHAVKDITSVKYCAIIDAR